MERRVNVAEIAVALVVIAMSTVFLWDARRYEASPFEPIGSGAVPAGVAAGAILLGVMQLIQAARALALGGASGARPELGLRVLGGFLLTLVYTVVLASGLVKYAYATTIFFALAVLVFAERPRPLAPWALGLALILGFGLDAVFRHVFVTNIP